MNTFIDILQELCLLSRNTYFKEHLPVTGWLLSEWLFVEFERAEFRFGYLHVANSWQFWTELISNWGYSQLLQYPTPTSL